MSISKEEIKEQIVIAINTLTAVRPVCIEVARQYAKTRLTYYDKELDDCGRNTGIFDTSLKKCKWDFFAHKVTDEAIIEFELNTEKNDIVSFSIEGEEYCCGDIDWFYMTVPWEVFENFDHWKETFIAQRQKEIEELQIAREEEQKQKICETERKERALYEKLKAKYEKP